jgi:DnaK suppressor protein
MATKKEPEKLTKKQLNDLKDFLEDERKKLIAMAKVALSDGLVAEKEVGRDELDESTDENLLAYELRLRDRERGKLKKIQVALQRIEDSAYNECELCGGSIGYARLKARPFTTMCIHCKEEQEIEERQRHDASRELQNIAH